MGADDNTLDKARDEFKTNNNELLVFELYCTDVGYGTGTSCMATKDFGIKGYVKYGKLLNELLLCMKVGTHFFQISNICQLALQLTLAQPPT